MSHTRIKIKYEMEAAYGSTEIGTLYADYNNSCDCVTIYNEYGDIEFTSCEWGTKDKATQLIKLLTNFSPEDCDEIEYWTKEDSDKINNRNK